MEIITFDQIKAQLRLDDEQAALEHDLLEMYGDAAEETVLNVINRSYYDVIDCYGSVPNPLLQAMLMLVDVSYQHRSPVTSSNISLVPYAFDLLVKPYIRLTSPDEVYTDVVTLGSDVKIEFTASLPDGLKLSDVDFFGRVINLEKKDVEVQFVKASCVEIADGRSYVVLVDSNDLGVGTLDLKLTVLIPDTDYPSGTRKEVIKINPHIRITG